MGGLFADMECVLVYLDDVLIIGAGTFEEHMNTVAEVLRKLEERGMQMNPQKSFWAKPQVEYLGFLVTREGIKPQSKKFRGS